MSLKAFHLVFIVAATLLSAGFGGWCFSQYGMTQEKWLFGMGVGSFLVTAGLALYLPWFLRRYRGLGYLALVLTLGSLLQPTTAQACAVCFGDPNSLMVKSANQGITFLLGVICAVLVAFAGLFIFWMVRARRLNRQSAPLL